MLKFASFSALSHSTARFDLVHEDKTHMIEEEVE